MKKFSEQVLSPHKHMSKKASPYHAHSQGLVYTPKGKEEIRPIDTADAGYGGEAVADGQGGEADAGRASKKAVAPMKMQTLVKKTNEGFDSSPADIAKILVAKHGKNVTKDHIRALEQDRDSHSGLDHDEIMQHVKKLQEETERERLLRLRSFAFQQKRKGLGADMHTAVSEEQIDELKKSTLASYAKKATDDVSYHSFTAGTMSAKDPERLAQDKKAMKRQSGVIKAIDRLAKEEVEGINEMDKSQPAAGRDSDTPYPKPKPIKLTDKQRADSELMTKQLTGLVKRSLKVKEEVELDERNMENKAKKDNVVRQVGTHAYIKHGTDAGSPKMTGRKVMSDPKFKSSKVADMYRKLPSMKEENNWNGPAEENDMALTQLHFIHYAAEKIIAAVEAGTDMEEWYQNKLSKLHGDMESLYSYMQGRQRFTGTLGDPMMEAKADVRVSVHKDIEDFLKKGGKVKQLPPSKATHRPGTALASKMIGSRGQVPGLARNVGGKKPVVAVEEGKMKDIATEKDEDKRLAAHAADMLGGPVKKKPEGPKGKLPLGYRLARSAAKKAMKSVSEKKTSKVPRVGELEMTLEEYADI